jgi:hypothetical protein
MSVSIYFLSSWCGLLPPCSTDWHHLATGCHLPAPNSAPEAFISFSSSREFCV